MSHIPFASIIISCIKFYLVSQNPFASFHSFIRTKANNSDALAAIAQRQSANGRNSDTNAATFNSIRSNTPFFFVSATNGLSFYWLNCSFSVHIANYSRHMHIQCDGYVCVDDYVLCVTVVAVARVSIQWLKHTLTRTCDTPLVTILSICIDWHQRKSTSHWICMIEFGSDSPLSTVRSIDETPKVYSHHSTFDWMNWVKRCTRWKNHFLFHIAYRIEYKDWPSNVLIK